AVEKQLQTDLVKVHGIAELANNSGGLVIGGDIKCYDQRTGDIGLYLRILHQRPFLCLFRAPPCCAAISGRSNMAPQRKARLGVVNYAPCNTLAARASLPTIPFSCSCRALSFKCPFASKASAA